MKKSLTPSVSGHPTIAVRTNLWDRLRLVLKHPWQTARVLLAVVRAYVRPVAAKRLAVLAVEPDGEYGDAPPEVWGPLHWSKLHEQALPENGGLTWVWLALWLQEIPCEDCRKFAIRYVLTNPPEGTGQQAWAVQLHNAANLKLGKPLWTLTGNF